MTTLKNQLGIGKGYVIFCKSTYIIYTQTYQNIQLKKKQNHI